MRTLTSIITSICMAAILMLSASPLAGQTDEASFSTYKGTLKDESSNEKLIFAYVTVPGTHIGTVTNSDGDFTLKVKKSLDVDKVEFSHLGYINKVVEIASLKPEGNVITLKAASVPLDEVTVRPQDPREIVLEALKKVPHNYSDTPNMITGFYRETVRQRRKYISISEAVLDIYKSSYRVYSDQDRVKLYKGRKSENVRRADTLAVKLQGGPSVSLLLDVAKNPEPMMLDGELEYYNFELEDMVLIDGNVNYVIKFEQKPHVKMPLYYGRIYIDTKNLAFTTLQFSLNLENEAEASRMFVRRKPIGVRITPTSTSYLVTYKEIDGTYYFNYARNEFSFTSNWRRRIFNSNYTVTSELAITDRNMEKANRIPYREMFRSTDILEDDIDAFSDEEFWGEHNYIEPDESIEAAIKRYGRRLFRW